MSRFSKILLFISVIGISFCAYAEHVNTKYVDRLVVVLSLILDKFYKYFV